MTDAASPAFAAPAATPPGLTDAEATRRAHEIGPNAVAEVGQPR